MANATFSLTAQVVVAFEAAIKAVYGNATVELRRLADDDVSFVDVIIPGFHGYQIQRAIAVAEMHLRNNANLSERVREVWIHQQETTEGRVHCLLIP